MDSSCKQDPFKEIYISNLCLDVTYQMFRETTFHLATKKKDNQMVMRNVYQGISL